MRTRLTAFVSAAVLGVVTIAAASATASADAGAGPSLGHICGKLGQLKGPHGTAVYDISVTPHKQKSVTGDRWTVIVYKAPCSLAMSTAPKFFSAWQKASRIGILNGVLAGWICSSIKPYATGGCIKVPGSIKFTLTGSYTLAQIRTGALGPLMAAYVKASK